MVFQNWEYFNLELVLLHFHKKIHIFQMIFKSYQSDNKQYQKSYINLINFKYSTKEIIDLNFLKLL